MFIVMINFTQPLDVIEQHVADHRQFLRDCYKKDYFVASGPRNPRTGGVIISQLKDRAELEKIIHQDPYHLRGVAEYEVIEFNPVLYHEDFAQFI
jgi:uncharacterized protein YciI